MLNATLTGFSGGWQNEAGTLVTSTVRTFQSFRTTTSPCVVSKARPYRSRRDRAAARAPCLGLEVRGRLRGVRQRDPRVRVDVRARVDVIDPCRRGDARRVDAEARADLVLRGLLADHLGRHRRKWARGLPRRAGGSRRAAATRFARGQRDGEDDEPSGGPRRSSHADDQTLCHHSYPRAAGVRARSPIDDEFVRARITSFALASDARPPDFQQVVTQPSCRTSPAGRP